MLKGNQDFNCMEIEKAELYIRALLSASLPETLYYHNLEHTLDVRNAARQLAGGEGVTSSDELTILDTAALFHDCGFVHVYQHHEEEGCRLAKEQLPALGYGDEAIDAVCGLIMKTNMKHPPETGLEKILCDADLDYLGRADFETIGDRLFREWMAIGKVRNKEEWNRMQVLFLESHQYWTGSAIRSRQEMKISHLLQLKKITGG